MILAGPARYSKRAWIAKKNFTANFFKKNGQVENLYGDFSKKWLSQKFVWGFEEN
jgi:hypothetical protein